MNNSQFYILLAFLSSILAKLSDGASYTMYIVMALIWVVFAMVCRIEEGRK